MNATKKTIYVLSLIVISTVILSFAQPVQAQNALENLIENIKRQIAVLQQRLADLQRQQNTIPEWCYTFASNLRVGDAGSGVVNLQIALNKEGLYNQSQTGVFDERLASAVVAFQEKYASAILNPIGLTHGTGYVGPATRARLNQLYGCNRGNDITIANVSGPTTLGVNQVGTWSISASDVDGNSLSYSVTWGDGLIPLSVSRSSLAEQIQTATFTHSYSAAGNYTITFRVSDSEGNTATRSMMVSVGAVAVQYPTANNQSVTVMKNASVNIVLTGSDPQSLPLAYRVVNNVSHGRLSGSGRNLVYTPDAGFTGSDSFTFKVNNGTYDSNTATVSISVIGPYTGQLTISSVSGPVALMVGQIGTWSISVSQAGSYPLSYSVTWGDENQSAPAASSVSSDSMSQTATFTHSYSAAGNYNVIFRVTDSVGRTATSTITVSVQ